MENPEIAPNFPSCNHLGNCEVLISDEVLSYLNLGGTLGKLVPVASKSSIEKIMDITGDGVQELVMRPYVTYHVIGCKDGRYEILFDFVGDFGVHLGGTPDLNKNGVPELILYDISHYGFVLLYIYEWADSEFRSLINVAGSDSILATSPHIITDINGDGLEELTITDDVHERETGFFGGLDVAVQRPLRNETIILGWNGQNFVDVKQGNYAPPQYRFQAIQDGDEQVRYANFTAALSFYQAAIFDDRLKWWSPTQREYELDVYMSRYEPTPTIYPTPSPDTTEYPRLAAYAYYRIMLLHFVQGHESDAGTVYKTLQQKFGNDSQGHPYVEMASTFWNAYQSTYKMYDGCAAAIQYAAEHPEILVPLGSDYHGSQSHIYVPADVCPFR